MRVWLLAIGVMLALCAQQRFAFAAPATVDTSSSAQATVNSFQRKTFFDSENEIHWAFYYNGTAIEYSRSADGVSWTSVGTLPYNTASYSAVYKTISGVSYVFVVAEANTHDIVLRRGVLGASAVTFDTALTIFDGSGVSNRYTKPTVAISGNNHLWVSAVKDIGAAAIMRFQVQARRSINLATGDLSAFNAATAVGRGVQTLREAVIVPRSGDAMYLISSTDGSSIVGYAFDGSVWSAANAGGDYSWFGFGMSGLNGVVTTIAVSGSDIYVGGFFQNAGGVAAADYIAKWDGMNWNALGVTAALNDGVKAIAISGTDIYVGGYFTDAAGLAGGDYIAKWDGGNWSALGIGLNSPAYSIGISGTDIYVGGSFWEAGGIASNKLARWDGNAWNAIANSPNAMVHSIVVSGSDVYIGGGFNSVGTDGAAYIARWDGADWRALGSGVDSEVIAIAVDGTDVYAGGSFQNAGGVSAADYVAKFNGTTWSALGVGVNGLVSAIAVAGSDVIVGGGFSDAGGIAAADYVAKWNGSTWSTVGNGLNNTPSVIVASGSDIYVGGGFIDSGEDVGADYITYLSEDSWRGLGSGGFNGDINAMAVLDGELYVGGSFTDAGGVGAADRVARWDGANWNAIGSGLNAPVYALIASGSNLYAGGSFTDAGDIAAADRIARFDGTSWSALGTGLNNIVKAIAIDGTDLYAGGLFTDAGSVAAADRIARWDGASWNALGSGLSATVRAIAISGSNVYAGGLFTNAGGIAAADYVSRWDGAAWSALGSGLNDEVYSIAISGSNVYVGGKFTDGGGEASADKIGLFNGTAWSGLGAGLNGDVNAIAISGSDLYAAGNFTNAGGDAAADYIARFNGTSWSGLGTGLDSAAQAVVVQSDAVFVAGNSMTISGFDQPAALAMYAPAITTDADATSELSSVSDAAGNVYLSFTDSSDHLHFRRYDDSDESWDSVVTLSGVASSSPSLTYDATTQKILASWVQSNDVTYSQAVTPYETGDWSVDETLYGTGTNTSVTAAANQESSDLPILWTSGAANPYSVLSDVIDMTAPSVVVTSSASSPTKSSAIPVSITFAEAVTGFTLGDIAVGNGAATSFVTVSPSSYTVTVVPTADGLVTVDVPAAAAKDAADFDNLAATQFSITSDRLAPSVAITSSRTSPTTLSPIPIAIEFSETVTGFALGDINVANGSVGSLIAVDGNSYTASLTPTASGAVTVSIGSAAAIDAAQNDSSAGSFSILYNAPVVDSDSDGVSDQQEAIDGTNSNDAGSVVSILPTQWCSEWNGYLGMYNINEYINLSSNTRRVVTTIFDRGGEAQSALGLSVLAGSQTDLLVHEMLGWTANSYGKVCSEVSGAAAGEVDGRMVYYKPNAQGFDFAFALPYFAGLSGSQFLTFNNMQPSKDSADANNVVGNWIQVTNLEQTQQRGRLIFYGQDGAVLDDKSIVLAAEAREDFAAHGLGSTVVGLAEWRPNSAVARFALRNTRYFYDNALLENSFDAALQLEGVKGNGELLSTPVDTRSQLAVLEVANTTASALDVTVKLYNAAGVRKETVSLRLPAYGSQHVVANGILNEELGSATVKGSSSGSVVAVAMHYGKTSQIENFGIQHVYGVIAKQPLGTTMRGSYNTFLGQGCELILVNGSNSSVTSAIEMKRLDGTIVLSNRQITTPAKATANFRACGAEQSDQYGVVTVSAGESNSIFPLIIRSGANGDYKFVTPVR